MSRDVEFAGILLCAFMLGIAAGAWLAPLL